MESLTVRCKTLKGIVDNPDLKFWRYNLNPDGEWDDGKRPKGNTHIVISGVLRSGQWPHVRPIVFYSGTSTGLHPGHKGLWTEISPTEAIPIIVRAIQLCTGDA